jgi:hypothetical protein
VRLSVVALLSLVVFLAAGGASAAPTWLSPQDLSAAGAAAEHPQVATDAAGDSFAVWQQWVGSNLVIKASVRPVGAAWIGAQYVSEDDVEAHAPRIAVNPRGDAIAAWYQVVNGSYVVEAAMRPAGGGQWGAPEEVSAQGVNTDSQQVAIDRAGNAIAVWRSFGPTPTIQTAVRPVGGTWSAPQNLSAPGGDAEGPEVAFDSAGNAVVVWERFNGTNYLIQASTRPAGGGWSLPDDLSLPGQDAANAQVALDPSGNAIVVWERTEGPVVRVQTAVRPIGGAWSAPQDLSAPGEDARAPQVAFDGYGNATAIWSGSNGAHYVIRAAERPFGGGWSAAEDLSAAGHSVDFPQLAVDPLGDAIAVWRRSDDGSNGSVQAAVRPAGGGWGAVRDLSTAAQVFDPDVAVDSAGNAVAVWMRFQGGIEEVIQAAGLDASGPVFDNLLIPKRGFAGRKLTFSVRSFDVWSILAGPPHWTFGDGTSADGWRVEHAYASGNAFYPVEVSEWDAVGNRTVFSGEDVSVSPALCLVPKVVGRTLARAKAAITRAHCRVGRVARAFSRQVRKGRVLAQRPKPGKRRTNGAPVNLVVSCGRRR